MYVQGLTTLELWFLTPKFQVASINNLIAAHTSYCIVILYIWILTTKDNKTQHREYPHIYKVLNMELNAFYASHCYNNGHIYICMQTQKELTIFDWSPLSLSRLMCTIHHGMLMNVIIVVYKVSHDMVKSVHNGIWRLMLFAHLS